MPLTPDDLFARLDEMGITSKTSHHPAVFTVEESTKIKDTIPGGHTKNLFLKDKKGAFFLLVAEGTAKIELNKIHGIIGASGRVSFGKPDALMELLGVEPGSVTAFSPINDGDCKVKVVIDEPLLRYEVLNCHPMINTMTTSIAREDLLRFLSAVDHDPMIVKFSI